MLSSGVTISEGAAAVVAIQPQSTSIPGFVGVAERGPLDSPTRITSFTQYREVFGDFLAGANRHLPLAVKSFFENGGSACDVVRVCHRTDSTDPTTSTATRSSATLTTGGGASVATLEGAAYPLDLRIASGLTLNVNGEGDLTATPAAAAAGRNSVSGPYSLTNGMELLVVVDGLPSQTITFLTADFVNISAATAAEVRDAINYQLVGGRATIAAGAVRIESDTKGTSSTIRVTGGTANAVLQYATTQVAGTGDVANLGAVTYAEIKPVIEAIFTGDTDLTVVNAPIFTLVTTATGAGATIDVDATTAAGYGLDVGEVEGEANSTVDGFDIEELHPAGLVYSVQVKAATSGDADAFDLLFSQSGLVIESYRNVTAATLISTLATQSKRFRAVESDEPDERPANQTRSITGGSSGLTSLADTDFVGGTSDEGPAGLYALNGRLDVSLLAIPGRASATIGSGVLAYIGQDERQLFAVLDTPSGGSDADAITYVETTASLLNATEQGAVYWPWLTVANPSADVFGTDATVTVAPSGAVLGIYARTDAAQNGGVYQSPAGVNRGVVRGIVGLENLTVNQKAVRDRIYPKRINPICRTPGQPIYIDGGRTLKGNGNFPSINERRGVNAISAAIKAALDFARHENNDATLRARVRRTINGYLLTQFQLGAFRGATPEEGYVVICDETNNPPEVVFQNRLVVTIGLATQKPAEFVEVTITQDTRGLGA